MLLIIIFVGSQWCENLGLSWGPSLATNTEIMIKGKSFVKRHLQLLELLLSFVPTTDGH